MVLNRRGVLAVLLSSPAFAQTQRRENGAIVIDFAPEMENAVVLEVHHKGRVIRLTASEVMAALELPVFPPLPDSYPSIPVGRR